MTQPQTQDDEALVQKWKARAEAAPGAIFMLTVFGLIGVAWKIDEPYQSIAQATLWLGVAACSVIATAALTALRNHEGRKCD